MILSTDAAKVEASLFALPYFRQWSPRVEVHDGEDLLWAISDIPEPLFNSVARARLTEEDVDDTIEEVIARCTARKVPALWWTGPSTTPTDLGPRLIAHGFREAGRHPGMVADLRLPGPAAPPHDPAVTIARVRDLEMLKAWNAIPEGVEERYEIYAKTMNEFRHFVAFVDGKPAGTASLIPAAGVAGIYNVYTAPQYRNRGVGTALTHVVLAEARALGYDQSVLQASPVSVSIYRSFGFIEVCTIGIYVWLI
jgi:GNAT superfamily N-acetyltransferase